MPTERPQPPPTMDLPMQQAFYCLCSSNDHERSREGGMRVNQVMPTVPVENEELEVNKAMEGKEEASHQEARLAVEAQHQRHPIHPPRMEYPASSYFPTNSYV